MLAALNHPSIPSRSFNARTRIPQHPGSPSVLSSRGRREVPHPSSCFLISGTSCRGQSAKSFHLILNIRVSTFLPCNSGAIIRGQSPAALPERRQLQQRTVEVDSRMRKDFPIDMLFTHRRGWGARGFAARGEPQFELEQYWCQRISCISSVSCVFSSYKLI